MTFNNRTNAFISRIDAYMTKIDAYLARQDAFLQSQATSLRNLETQMGQITQPVSSCPPRTFPNDIINNPKGCNNEHCKAYLLERGRN